MFDHLTNAERVKLGIKLSSARIQFLREYDALKDASPAVVASYGRTALATDWLMCCVETGHALNDLRASWTERELVWCELVNAPAHQGKHEPMPNCRHPRYTGTYRYVLAAHVELERQAAELARRIRNQESTAAGRHADVIAHRRECGNCIPGHLCRDGKKFEKELRISLDVLRKVKAGEL